MTEEQLEYVDCYVHNHFGIFIPFQEGCGYAAQQNHTHPSYMIVIHFEEREEYYAQYEAYILSPELPHTDDFPDYQYYCILIDKEYFENVYRMYEDEVPVFDFRHFQVCHDILKTLNLFAFEYSKNMKNSAVTMEAQATILTHWLVRSLLGESLDMRSISSEYAVARAQHYIEQHFSEEITVGYLAKLGNLSESSFNRKFKKELQMTPMEYVMDVRLEQAKKLLKRAEIPITQVALRCGFGSGSHLASGFQKAYHTTPSEYRKRFHK
ncbi:MAG: helix-turn-helix domain-containing protein [Coprococcus sp.]